MEKINKNCGYRIYSQYKQKQEEALSLDKSMSLEILIKFLKGVIRGSE